MIAKFLCALSLGLNGLVMIRTDDIELGIILIVVSTVIFATSFNKSPSDSEDALEE